MTSQLSPDRQYYWDGAKWVSAVSPDGAWRWDGTAWRPAAARVTSSNGRRVTAIIAAGVLATLIVGVLGVFLISRAWQFEQSGLANIGLACKGPSDPAGSAVAVGDTVCGYKLGPARVTASCVGATSVPDGLQAWKQASGDSDATKTDLPVDADGCNLSTSAGETVWLQAAQSQTPDVTVIADFTPRTDWGYIGVRLACNYDTCVVLVIDPAGVYRLDEERGHGNWQAIATGALPLFTISRLGQLNRVVMRYRDRSVQVFLNGYVVVRASTSFLQSAGAVGVYLDDRVGGEAAIAHVRTLDVFASV